MVPEFLAVTVQEQMQAVLQLMLLRGRGRLHLMEEMMGYLLGHSAKSIMVERAMQDL